VKPLTGWPKRLTRAYGNRQVIEAFMNKKFINLVVLIFIIVVGFSGCASRQFYYWGNYEPQVYAHLKGGDSPERQITVLERDRQTIESRGLKAPPGFYAHLGFLYTEVGNSSDAIACFETEKSLFPEAAVYMDFLLTNMRR
jgi:hypothetical protein